ncbi:hypothetical protein ACXG0S_002057 [Campylobacter coli]
MSEKDKNRRKKMTMQIIQDQIPQELSGRMTKQSLERLANHLHLATQNEMGGYSTMATLGLSDNLQTIRFKRELSESLSRNTDEPRNTAQSRLSGAESRESRAIISANKEFQNINDEKIPSKLSKEESKEFNISAL